MNSIEEVFESLHESASTRTKRSLIIINDICKEQVERNSTDFSYATIGKFSSANGGVTVEAIRNKNGKLYKELIDTYAHEYKSKEPLKKSKKTDNWTDEIKDGRIRALANIAIAEKNNYKSQLDKLRSINTLEIDMRKETQQLKTDVNHVGLNLNRLEVDALSDAISKNTLSKLNCYIDEEGFVIHQNNSSESRAYKPAYVAAIQKILTVN